jgi:hypothetical protein
MDLVKPIYFPYYCPLYYLNRGRSPVYLHIKRFLHDVFNPVHLHGANLLRIRLIRIQKLTKHNRLGLDLPAVEYAARMYGHSMVTNKSLITAVRAETRGIRNKASEKRC